jgi:hypothetical protein
MDINVRILHENSGRNNLITMSWKKKVNLDGWTVNVDIVCIMYQWEEMVLWDS